MSIKQAKPITPGRREARYSDFKDVDSNKKPEKSLTKAKSRTNGRNSQGKITVRHRGGGAKRKLRVIDFKRDKFDIPATVRSIEYDPNRGARIALLVYKDGEKRYIIASNDLKVGDEVISSKDETEIKTGNSMPVKFVPSGISIYNVELEPGKGGKLARGAGNSIKVMSVEEKYAQIKMPSGEIRLIKKDCLGTIGRSSNSDKRHLKLGLAGRKRKLGFRPTVRGSVMNPIDHPHGGGEGNKPIGMKFPKTKWGKNAYGVKTRKNKKTDKFIIQRRKKKKKK